MSRGEDNRLTLSKSKIASFEHCHKRLWLQIHCREAAIVDESTLARFRFGHEVGHQAQLAVPGGVLVDTGFDMPAAIARTKALMALPERRPIFEATFQHEDVLIRADILLPDKHGSWQMVEVKGSHGTRPHQIADVATQVWTIVNSDVPLSSAVIRHLARPVKWWRPDRAAISFRDADVSGPVSRALPSRPRIIAAARQVVRGPEPQQPIGMHCYRPFGCEFRDHCRAAAGLPPLTAQVDRQGAAGRKARAEGTIMGGGAHG